MICSCCFCGCFFGRRLLKNPPLPLLTFQHVKNNFSNDSTKCNKNCWYRPVFHGKTLSPRSPTPLGLLGLTPAFEPHCCCVKNTPLPLSTFQNVCTAFVAFFVLFLSCFLLLDAGVSCCVLFFQLFVLLLLPLLRLTDVSGVDFVAAFVAAAVAAALGSLMKNPPLQLLTKCLCCFSCCLLLFFLPFVMPLLLFFMFVFVLLLLLLLILRVFFSCVAVWCSLCCCFCAFGCSGIFCCCCCCFCCCFCGCFWATHPPLPLLTFQNVCTAFPVVFAAFDHVCAAFAAVFHVCGAAVVLFLILVELARILVAFFL